MLGSVKAGWSEISPQTDAVLIALVDQPTVTPPIIDRIISAFWKGDKKIAVPVFNGHRGHPVIFDRDLQEEVMRLDETSPDGLKAVLTTHSDQILEVPVDSSSVLEDIDNPDDYTRLSQAVQPVYEHHKWQP
jgi:molybdenum cofactor cytidylyltransferase